MTRTPINPSTAQGSAVDPARLLITCLAQVDQDRFHAAVHVLLLAQSKLREDRVDVLLDHPQREMEPVGDSVVVAALGHFRQNVALSLRELLHLGANLPAPCSHEGFDDLRIYDRPASRHLSDGGGQVGRVVQAVFEQVGTARGAPFQEAEGVFGLIVLAEHDHTYLWVLVAQASRRLNAFVGVAGWHANVGHHHVGPVPLNSTQQAFEVDAATGQLDFLVRLQEPAHALAHQVAVLGQNHSDLSGHGAVRMPRNGGLIDRTHTLERVCQHTDCSLRGIDQELARTLPSEPAPAALKRHRRGQTYAVARRSIPVSCASGRSARYLWTSSRGPTW